jgi:drug/metabolite transporter (DMT)-like permease
LSPTIPAVNTITVLKNAPESASELARLATLGLVAAALFSSTFILNRAMSLDGGHWVWSASLRYFFAIGLLGCWLAWRRGSAHLRDTLICMRTDLWFWIVTGSVGCGVFYAGLSYASAYAPGWAVATTWQTTLIASMVVLYLFGLPVPKVGLVSILIIFAGIVLVNLSGPTAAEQQSSATIGMILVLISAFAYPLGNQLLHGARHGRGYFKLRSASPVLSDAASCVLLLSLGSVPFWLALIAFFQPPPPSAAQCLQTFGVALFSGVLATTLFLHARNAARTSLGIAAVDATQAAEVLFALLGEVWLLSGAWPAIHAAVGLILLVIGILGFAFAAQTRRGERGGAEADRAEGS